MKFPVCTYIYMYIHTEEIGSGVCFAHIPTSQMIPSVAGSWSNVASVCIECRHVSASRKWSPQP